jgi:hypothetical protein
MNQTLHPSAKGVAALYCLGGDLAWLTHSYLSVYPCVERIYFFLSSCPWHGDDKAAVVDPSMLSALPDPLGKKEIVQGSWTNEVEQRNYTAAYAQYNGFSYGLIVDADEVYESAHLTELILLSPINLPLSLR